jgi:DnaJ-class molecular chaperone
MDCFRCGGHGEWYCPVCNADGRRQTGSSPPCDRCGGIGYVICPTCGGTGYLEQND